MILPDFKAFPCQGRIVGLDWGARRIGLAVSDENRDFVFVRPQINVRTHDADVASVVADAIKKENAVGVVIGLPVHSDGTESETALLVRAFADKLDACLGVAVCFIEENLTSVAAQEQMGRVRIADIKQRLDSESARVILENAIAILKRIKC